MFFTENNGQFYDDVLYHTNDQETTVYFCKNKIVTVLTQETKKNQINEQDDGHIYLNQKRLREPQKLNMISIIAEQSNIIYVGRKLPMDYVLAIVTAFSGSEVKEITVKARGRSITTAVDAVEIARRKFVKETKVDKVVIGTEEMPPREGESNVRNISSIEITLKRI